MPAHEFYARVQRAKQAAARAEKEREAREKYEHIIAALSALEGMYEGDSLERQIQRRFRAYAEVIGDDDFLYTPLVKPAKDEVAKQDWDDLAREDRRINILRALWVWETIRGGDRSPTFTTFSEITAARALLTLLTYREHWNWQYECSYTFIPHGLALLASLYEPHEWHLIPRPEHCLAFVKSGWLDERDPEQFLSALFYEVKGSREAIARILAHYNDVVRAEWDVLGLRGDEESLPYGDYPARSVVTWDTLIALFGSPDSPLFGEDQDEVAMTTAIEDYRAGKGSLRGLAQQYSLSPFLLRQALIERGILRPRGRQKEDS